MLLGTAKADATVNERVGKYRENVSFAKLSNKFLQD